MSEQLFTANQMAKRLSMSLTQFYRMMPKLYGAGLQVVTGGTYGQIHKYKMASVGLTARGVMKI